MSARTDRINELARKEKSVGLTPEEFKTLYVLTYKALANMENAQCKRKN